MKQCIIVGGGLIGMLTAKALVESGVKITIVDKSQAGQESSWAGGGILSPLYPWRYPEAITQLCLWSQQHYPALCAALAQTTHIDPQHQQSGLLMLDIADMEQARSWAQRYHYPWHETIPNTPTLAQQNWRNAFMLPNIAHVRNPRLLQALRNWLEQHDVRFIEHCTVSQLHIEDNQIRGVQIANNPMHAADTVVIASGAWSQTLLASTQAQINVYPVQGQMILFKTEPDLIPHIIMHDGFYVIPRRDGHVLAGSTLEHRGFDKCTTTEALQHLQQRACTLIPALKNYPVVKHWAGLRPGSPTGVPYIGQIPGISGLYVNTGHFRNGVVMGPASAQLLADLMLNRPTILPADAYQPTRQRPTQACQHSYA